MAALGNDHALNSERLSAAVERWEVGTRRDWLLTVERGVWTWKEGGVNVHRDAVPFRVQRMLSARLHPDRDCSVCRSIHGSEIIHPCE